MNKPCGRGAVGPLISVSVAIRLIRHFAIDDTAVHNAAWLCPLLGFVLFLPIGISLRALSQACGGCALNAPLLREKKVGGFLVTLIAFAVLVLDASENIHLLANTANVMALGEIPLWLIAAPIALTAFVCACIGLEAGGRSARLWIWILLPLLAVMLLMQLGDYRSEWLTPIFGGGMRAIGNGSIASAGYMGLLALPWLICVEDRCKKGAVFFVLSGTLAASAALALLGMLAPTLIQTRLSGSARIELVLSNGRVHLMLQLLMVVIWFCNLLHLLNAECAGAVEFVRKSFPAFPRCAAAALAAACA